MNTRMRSPSYPSTALSEAIDLIAKLHKAERTNPTERGVAVQAMGYSGISGRSAKILSDLAQYGLLEKGAKNEVRVSRRAVEILYPDSAASKRRAIREAVLGVELFQRISERFPDGRPSEAALRSYFVREEFTDAAIPSAIKAYMETYQFMEDANVSGSHSQPPASDLEISSDQPLKRGDEMRFSTHHENSRGAYERVNASHQEEMDESRYSFDPFRKRVKLGAWISSQREADEAISYISALKAMLPAYPPTPSSEAGGIEPETKDDVN
ncbi:MAG: hypothetical protein NW215_03420 [Hyphomicrobiales bacterium]|nr:hypothetical protein [Hyphomicrobiales bacterium]